MELKNWPSYPHQVDKLVEQWQEKYPRYLIVDFLTQHLRQKVYMLTVTDRDAPQRGKKKQMFTVPHAHEPAGTVGSLNFIHQLLTGHHLDGTASTLDRKRILEKTLISFNPDSNPGGRMRSPVHFWDGTRYTNEEFWAWMRGIDPETLSMFKRVARWSIREENPLRIGIVYEQLNEHEFVEPNRDMGSSLLRLVVRYCNKWRYDQYLSLHQTEFQGRADRANAMIILPVVQTEIGQELQECNMNWAMDIIGQWKRAGARPIEAVKPLNYGEPHRSWFIECWGWLEKQMPCITVEIQNNNPDTPPEKQLLFMDVAIRESAERLLR
ncbi:MAG: M14 family zinc carboxypeptidase [Planctomycetota bacterium]